MPCHASGVYAKRGFVITVANAKNVGASVLALLVVAVVLDARATSEFVTLVGGARSAAAHVLQRVLRRQLVTQGSDQQNVDGQEQTQELKASEARFLVQMRRV